MSYSAELSRDKEVLSLLGTKQTKEGKVQKRNELLFHQMIFCEGMLVSLFGLKAKRKQKQGQWEKRGGGSGDLAGGSSLHQLVGGKG